MYVIAVIFYIHRLDTRAEAENANECMQDLSALKQLQHDQQHAHWISFFQRHLVSSAIAKCIPNTVAYVCYFSLPTYHPHRCVQQSAPMIHTYIHTQNRRVSTVHSLFLIVIHTRAHSLITIISWRMPKQGVAYKTCGRIHELYKYFLWRIVL